MTVGEGGGGLERVPGRHSRAPRATALWIAGGNPQYAWGDERPVPRVCEFYGIAIYIHWGDHGPPHFHARYAGEKASIAIDDVTVLAGRLSPRALGLVVEWAAIRRSELRRVWRQAGNNEPLDRIEPLP